MARALQLDLYGPLAGGDTGAALAPIWRAGLAGRGHAILMSLHRAPAAGGAPGEAWPRLLIDEKDDDSRAEVGDIPFPALDNAA